MADRSEKIKAYDRDYKRKIYKSYTVRFNRESDKEIIEYFDKVADKTNFIKDAIKKDMKRGQ